MYWHVFHHDGEDGEEEEEDDDDDDESADEYNHSRTRRVIHHYGHYCVNLGGEECENEGCHWIEIADQCIPGYERE